MASYLPMYSDPIQQCFQSDSLPLQQIYGYLGEEDRIRFSRVNSECYALWRMDPKNRSRIFQKIIERVYPISRSSFCPGRWETSLLYSHFADANRIKSITLNRNRVDQTFFSAIAVLCHSLRTLALHNCYGRISQLGAECLGVMTQLRSLSLRNCGLGNVQVESFHTLTNLRQLDLSYNLMLTNKSIAGFQHLPYLQTLLLHQLPLIDESVGEAISRYTSLTKLDVGYCRQLNGRFLSSIQSLPLRSLNISGIKIFDDDVLLLDQFTELKVLYFNDHSLTDRGLSNLNGVMTRITHLAINQLQEWVVHITDRGLTSPSFRSPSITYLDISGINDVGEGVIQHLADHFPNLKHLVSRRCIWLEHDSLQPLAKLSYLRRVELTTYNPYTIGLLRKEDVIWENPNIKLVIDTPLESDPFDFNPE